MRMKNYLLSLFVVVLALPVQMNGQTVILGNGSAISVFSPLNRTNDYCVYEVIYLASQIGISDTINALAFQRHDGTNVDPIENVSIYMKHTPLTQLTSSTFDTTGYTLVYNGDFPNDAGAGWREVILDNGFGYNNVDNLMVLTVKGYQQAIANTPVTPRWIYTNISPAPARARRYYDDFPIDNLTPLTTTVFTSNARLTFGTTGTVEIVDDKVSFYPNPSTGTINFNIAPGKSGSSLKIFAASGALVYEKNNITGTKEQVEGLVPGIYFFRITGNDTDHISTGKIVVYRQ